VAARHWSDALLAATGLEATHMPRLVEGSEASGGLRSAVAEELGLAASVVVAGGAGDNAASAAGIGVAAPGTAFLSLGTSGVYFVANAAFSPAPERAVHAFCHCFPDTWHQMSVMLSAASCLRWFCTLVGANEATLLAELGAGDSAVNAPIFLPYLAGERTPHNDPFAPGVFHGLKGQTTRADCTYAVLEGVAFGLADGLAALRAAGTEVTQLSLVGGGSRSPYWAQLIADALNVEIVVHAGSEAGGALGAARLGWLAAGGHVGTVCTRPDIAARFTPDAAHHARLAPRLARFRDLYARLRGA
jgi:xylulokinase